MNRSSALKVPGGLDRLVPRPPQARGYSTKDVAALLGLSAAQVRSYVRAGFLAPSQGPRGEYYFSFQDLIVLRTAKGLLAARVPRRRVRLALQNLREQLPEDRALTGVRISAQGHHVVVRDGRDVWNPESGQAVFDFELAELARGAATLPLRTPAREEDGKPDEPEQGSDWYEHGAELEEDSPEEAMAAYRRALEIEPDLADAHVNLGRLLHERGEIVEAERHYRLALAARPDDTTAAYNLGVVLQDLGRLREAADAYVAALDLDRTLADAHYNLSGIYEQLGEPEAAFRHLRTYRTLIQRG
ncbi:MAG TPA: tetratricopeptide repeat protein [Thermoanaerobaculia bacterium]|jgi:tetratricopeptide (TPR) repeat protein|nr:tetratricopeptide repeat protein [Thermoanaerobaculia bacterium]